MIKRSERGSEFKTNLLSKIGNVRFGIACLLSAKGTPYDNAVAKATFKTIKAEFVKVAYFPNHHELDLELFDYVHWFNHIRIQGSLNCLTLTEYKLMDLQKSVQFSVEIPMIASNSLL